jgi:hypothetical protein
MTEGYTVKVRHTAKKQWGVCTNPTSTNNPPKVWHLDEVNPCVPTGDDLKGEECRVWRIYYEDGILASVRVDDSIAACQGEQLQLVADAEDCGCQSPQM